MLLTTWLLACKSATPTPEPTDTDTDVPTPEACTDDLDEPNDTSDDAVAIEGNHLAVLASGNEDWWSITVPAGQRADVTLIAPASGANLGRPPRISADPRRKSHAAYSPLEYRSLGGCSWTQQRRTARR